MGVGNLSNLSDRSAMPLRQSFTSPLNFSLFDDIVKKKRSKLWTVVSCQLTVAKLLPSYCTEARHGGMFEVTGDSTRMADVDLGFCHHCTLSKAPQRHGSMTRSLWPALIGSKFGVTGALPA